MERSNVVGIEGAFSNGRVMIAEELALICVSLKRVEFLHSCREEKPFWRRREREGECCLGGSTEAVEVQDCNTWFFLLFFSYAYV